MRALFPFGWLLLFAAALGAAAEVAARAGPHAGGFLLSAYDVWYALWPGSLVVAKIRIEALLGPWAWDPLATGVLAVPLWVLFGLPGWLLIWLGRPRPGPRDEAGRQEERDEEEALFLYDSLAERAEAEEREFAAFEERRAAGEEGGDQSPGAGGDGRP